MKGEINYSLIPEYMRDGVRLYLEEGLRPGHFLNAVLENNLVEAAARADRENKHRLLDWATFLYNELPMGCWGSKEKVAAWIKKKREEKRLSENKPVEQVEIPAPKDDWDDFFGGR